MSEWTHKELEQYRQLVCSEQIAPSCEGCAKAEGDIDRCYQELKTDMEF